MPPRRCDNKHSPTSGAAMLAPSLQNADLTLPRMATSRPVWQGKLGQAPSVLTRHRLPLLIFLHGSSGLNQDTRQFQRWLADELSLASLAPDSFAMPQRPRYRSPAGIEEYEAVHRLRQVEIENALALLPQLPWVDPQRLVLAGSSEGGVAVARWKGNEFLGRIIYSWPCEDNYFVDQARNGFDADTPILNILSDNDPYFAHTSSFNRGLSVLGHSSRALQGATRARMAVLPGAPHTLYNLPDAYRLSQTFLYQLLGVATAD